MAPRKKEENEALRERRREKLLSAALRVFARRGYVGTKASDIAKEADFSHGLTYHYFSSKEAIFKEIVRQALQKSQEQIEAALKQTGSPYKKIEWLTKQMLTVEQDDLYYFLIMLQVFTSEAIPRDIKTMVDSNPSPPVQVFMPLILEGQRKDQILQDRPDRLAMMYFSFVHGILLLRLQGAPAEIESDVAMVMRIFNKGADGI